MKLILNNAQNKDQSTTVLNMDGNTLYIYDYIGEHKSWWDEDDTTVTANDFVNELKKVTGDITVRINSKGGEVGNALAIYQQLREHNGKVTCVVDGYAYSCAAWLMLAGEDRYINTGGLVMIHNPMMYVLINSEETVEEVMPQWRAHRDAINLIISERTGLASDKVTELMNAETFMTSKEAISNGFCTALRNETAKVPESVRNSLPEEVKQHVPIYNEKDTELATKSLLLRSKIVNTKY